MKRDIDLARQLLLDIEARGADCSVSVLRTDPNQDAEERVRYHLRLLLDAGYLKEIDRTSSGVPCLRLTDAGHELIELTRSEPRWREAKWLCQERTGGLSVVVVRAILLERALAPPRRALRRRYRSAEPTYLVDRPYPYAAPPALQFDDEGDDWDYAAVEAQDADERVRYVRVRPKSHDGWRARSRQLTGDLLPEVGLEPMLPEHLI